jgi:hypothetical protein
VKDWAEIQRACEWLAKSNIHLVWGPAATSSATTSPATTATPQSAGRVLLRDGPDE